MSSWRGGRGCRRGLASGGADAGGDRADPGAAPRPCWMQADNSVMHRSQVLFALVGLASQAESDGPGSGLFEQQVRRWTLVRECYALSGDTDYLLTACVAPGSSRLPSISSSPNHITPRAPNVQSVRTILDPEGREIRTRVPLAEKRKTLNQNEPASRRGRTHAGRHAVRPGRGGAGGAAHRDDPDPRPQALCRGCAGAAALEPVVLRPGSNAQARG